MSEREPAEAPPSSARLSANELALRLGIDPELIDRLADAGAIERGGDGAFDPGDLHRVRLLNAFAEAGVPVESLLAASRAGAISLAYYDELHPPPGPASNRSYAEFAASLGPDRTRLNRLFAAFGLAEPDPHARLAVADEALIAGMLEIVVATGQPDLALRAVRLFGEATRRAADAVLGVYGEAIERQGDGLKGLPLADVFDRMLRPWARFARQSSALGEWLATRHMSRAIDEYSVTETERILEERGFMSARVGAPQAVAFVDLTGFTRLAEERGDEVAAEIAMRLGDLTIDVVEPLRGRVVKLLGDGVLIRFDDVTTAAVASLELIGALPRSGLPTGHAGVAAGPLIVRDGDVFGRTVNMAARISDVTPDGRLYMPESVASKLTGDRLAVRPVDAADLQGIGRVALVDVSLKERRESD